MSIPKIVPQVNWRQSFSKVFAAGADTQYWTNLVTAAGQTIAQTAGSLVLTSGTTANEESITRSKTFFNGPVTLRYGMTLSQRIVNNNFFVELVDVVGDALPIQSTSTTTAVVTFPLTVTNPWTTANIGQSVYIGNITGLVAAVPGRYAIANVEGNSVTFTVSGWPASGTGTVSLFGWNYHQVLYTGTTATNANFDSQRNGYATGATTATINTSASPGHIGVYAIEDNTAIYLDQLAASTTSVQLTTRGSRVNNLPSADANLYLQVRMVNGSTNPATTTTATISFVAVEQYVPQQVSISSIRPVALNSSLPVQVTNSPAITVTSLVPGVAATSLGKAEDAVSASGDTGVFVLGVRRDTLTSSASATGDYSEVAVNTYGAVNVIQYEKMAKTYSCSAQITAAAAATDIAIIPGTASTIVYVTKVTISGVQTTGGVNDVQLIKRSTANSGGTSAAMTGIPHDSTDAAAVSLPLSYSANPTPGTAVGTIRRGYLPLPAATGIVNPIVEFNFGVLGRPIVLRGVAQGLAVNLGGATITGGTFDVNYEWFEI